PLVRAQPVESGATEVDRALVGDEARQRVDQAGLAGPVGTDEAGQGARLEVERHSVDGAHAAVAHRERSGGQAHQAVPPVDEGGGAASAIACWTSANRPTHPTNADTRPSGPTTVPLTR